jgi:hypothetical protein
MQGSSGTTPAGTVLPASTTLHVVGDIQGFTQLNTGKGLLVAGPLSAPDPSAGKPSAAPTRSTTNGTQLLSPDGQLVARVAA